MFLVVCLVCNGGFAVGIVKRSLSVMCVVVVLMFYAFICLIFNALINKIFA